MLRWSNDNIDQIIAICTRALKFGNSGQKLTVTRSDRSYDEVADVGASAA